MRIIQADCTIRYTGRCETFLEEANRLILVKDDGSVMIHVDSGIKALNYMKASSNIQFIEQDGHKLLYAANKKEELYVDLLATHQDIYLPFPDSERKMVKTGTEALLQEEIFERYGELVPGHKKVCREFETGKGPVDIFGISEDESEVSLIEVKRHAHRKDIYQVLKYGDGIDAMVADARAKEIEAVEAKQKGDHDESGTMISVDALANRKLYLASLKFARGTIKEAEGHNVGIIDMSKNEREELKRKIEAENEDIEKPDVEKLRRGNPTASKVCEDFYARKRSDGNPSDDDAAPDTDAQEDKPTED